MENGITRSGHGGLMFVADDEARLVEVSVEWGRSLGEAPEALAGTALLDRVHPDDRALCQRWLDTLIHGQNALPARMRVRTADEQFALLEFAGIGAPEHGLAFATVTELQIGARDESSAVMTHPSGLTVDTASRRATVNDVELPLTASEFDLLALLMRHQGTVLSADRIAQSVWSYQTAGSRNFLQAHISRLRRKLADAGISGLVGTVRGIGYVIR